MFTLFTVSQVSSQTEFTKFPLNPIVIPGGNLDLVHFGLGSVLKDEGQYHFWTGASQSSYNMKIIHLISFDGLYWLQTPDSFFVVDKGEPGDWDEINVQKPHVIKSDGI